MSDIDVNGRTALAVDADGASTGRRYRAFVSFNHEADELVAAALQSSLTRFAKPWYRLRSMRIFRDATSLSANPALWNAIEAALAQSEYLVLLASPGSAHSPWVQRELQWWLAHRPVGNLIVCLTGGTILWNDQAGDFDWQKTTAISAALRGAFPAEPLYADFRKAVASGRLTESDSGYRAALLDVAAPLMGRSKDDVDGEDIRLHRRARRTAWTAAALIVTLGLAAGLTLVLAQQRQRIARSRALASAAATPLDDRSLALLLGIEARRIADTVEARRSILGALQRVPNTAAYLWGHAKAVTEAVFSPDGRVVLSAGWDDRLILWDVATHQPLGTPIATTKGLTSVAFDPDGSRFATAAHGEVVVWSTQTRQPLGGRFEIPGEDIVQVAFSATGQLLAAATAAYGGHPARVHVWDLISHRPLITDLPGSSMAFAPGDSLMAVSRYGDVILVDLHTRRELSHPLEGSSANLTSITFDGDGALVAAGAENGAISIWEAGSRRALGRLTAPDTVSTLRFDAGNGSLYSGSIDGTLVRWRLEDMTASATLVNKFGAAISSVYLAPDGTGAAAALDKERVVLLRLDGDPPLGHHIAAPGSAGSNIAFSPDGRLLASAAEFGDVAQWTVADGTLSGMPLSGHERQVSSLAYTPDGKVLVSGSMDGSLRFWSVADHASLGPPVQLDRSPVWALACSRNGKWLVQAGDAQLGVWDLETRVQRGPPITALQDRIWNLAFSPRGDLLAATVNSLQTTLWKTSRQMTLVKTLGEERARDEFEVMRAGVAFDPDGRLLAATSPGDSVTLWNIGSGEPVPPILYGHTRAVTSVAFSSDGQILATGSADGDIRLWDVPTHEPLGILGPRQKGIDDLEFQPGSSLLASVGEDDVITFWNVNVDDWVTRACRVANRNLTPREWRIYMGTMPYRRSCPYPAGM